MQPQSTRDAFNVFLPACDLFDLGFIGQEYTWWNARVTHVDDDFSDHLNAFKSHSQRRKKYKKTWYE